MGAGKKCLICKVVGFFVVVGALNWGLVGLLDFNLVTKIFGDMTMGAKAVYALIGLAAVVKIITCFKSCPGCCKTSGGSCS